VGSSRVPAGGEVSSKVPAKRAVRCQRTEPGGTRRKDHEQASHNRQTGQNKDGWDDDRTGTRP